jgi:diamine N-acetyltransferase
MTHSITIRSAQVAETAALDALFEGLDEFHRLALPDIFRKPPAARREQVWLEQTIAGPDSAILVAEQVDNRLIGLAVLIMRKTPAIPIRAARQFVEIVELVVAAEARHLGVGRSLVEGAKEWARERGIPALEVSAWSFNVAAIDFYKKIGFQQTVERFAMESGGRA